MHVDFHRFGPEAGGYALALLVKDDQKSLPNHCSPRQDRQPIDGLNRMTRTSLGDLKKGDRLLLQELDNSRYVLEVTSASHGAASGKRIGPDGTAIGRVQRVKSWQLLCREGGTPIKGTANLVPDDLIYDPYHRSGLQYCKAVLISGDHVGILRWNEAREEWTKHPTQPSSYEIEYLGRADNIDDLKRFFVRIKTDRAAWEASPGRSGMVQVKGDERGTYGWREKQRRWQGEGKAPVRVRAPKPDRHNFDTDAKIVSRRTINVNLSAPHTPTLPPEPKGKSVPDAPRSAVQRDPIGSAPRQNWLSRIIMLFTGRR